MADLTTQREKILMAFDFDNTLIDDNVDLAVVQLAPGGKIPDDVRALYSDDGWTEYMGAVFCLLHEHGVTAAQIRRHVHQIPLTPGMSELFHYMHARGCFECIIISDANSVLIQYSMEKHQLDSAIAQVFTNPADVDRSGRLHVRRYHTQDWCQLSTVNLCKGRILQDYIKQRSAEGVKYSCVLYVGDGSNDLCPGLTLAPHDYLLPRKGFSLWKKIQQARSKPDSKVKGLKASVVGWDSGVDIMNLLERIVADCKLGTS
ncbi:hypothetical protein C0Q70_09178 [Pomacea canaliculata]|uniref:Uncharacterized protein n=2 Tax=Pomacea canaliculata TaxID=400727 RepID=A0A2T7P929_POMCA|nr:pyridoxal phosphate phosphatase PHOSPHO2-like isoform X2 [Pomacea canaliculata]XP_025095152.1 pyridoxal phosphate phosphatase PHOSPHO2-like isoform X2 [Pomacea canaliculata]XP_025095153.1 pyridoxal phosphate phosphatase PHOSPHO2-like isoform X2 [Pomacea canaliculata]XP_025095154.1 pyridoxal phosphate phosphatase PHOSPHO2-like isoform X2 [Pomacea canaliculata]PVD29919.1 hypothetical protein C0Q70_09178 [Pomacea canaliculata]